jgi:hypothetical protein
MVSWLSALSAPPSLSALSLVLALAAQPESWAPVFMQPNKDKPEMGGWVDVIGMLVKVPFTSGKPTFGNATHEWKQGNDLFTLNKDDKGAPRFVVTCAPFAHTRFEGTLRESHEWQIFTKDKWAMHLQSSNTTLVAKAEEEQGKLLEDVARKTVATHRKDKPAFEIADFKWQKKELDKKAYFSATGSIDGHRHWFYFWQSDLEAGSATSAKTARMILITYSDQVTKDAGGAAPPPPCFQGVMTTLKARWVAK